MIKKINLIKRQAISIDEFRSWLYQLVQDKKGALPDLDDWKMIKEQLDKVGTKRTGDFGDDGSGYCIMQNDDEEYMDFEPYNVQFTFDLFDKLCAEAEMAYATDEFDHEVRDGLYNHFQHEYLETWHGDEHGMKNYNKEYDNGQTKTEPNRESDPDYDF